MLPQAERLKRAGLFQRVFSARKAVSSEIISLNVLPKQGRVSARMPLVGFVASKKIWSKASDRNRAKRRLREAYQLLKKSLSQGGDSQEGVGDPAIAQWYAIVFVAQEKLLEARFEDILKSMQLILEKADKKFGEGKARTRTSPA